MLLLLPLLMGCQIGEPNLTSRWDGATQLYIASNGESAQNPSLSPSGKALLFDVYNKGFNSGNSSLYLMDPGIRIAQEITQNNKYSFVSNSQAWSLNPRRICLSSDKSGHSEIWIANSTGSDLSQVSKHDDGRNFVMAACSNDGKEIVFAIKSPDNSNSSIWKISSSGDALVKLSGNSESEYNDSNPIFSPQNDSILFQRRKGGGNWQIWSMKIDGSNQKQISREGSDSMEASYSSDGKWILYTSNLGSLPVSNIFLVPTNGGDTIRVTKDTGSEDRFPVMSNDMAWIYFQSRQVVSPTSPASIWRIQTPELPVQ